MLANFADGQTIVTSPDQKAKHAKAGFMAKGCKGKGGGVRMTIKPI